MPFTQATARRSRGPASTPSAICCAAPPSATPTSSPSSTATRRVTFAEFDAAVNRGAQRARRPRAGQGRPARAARRTTAGSSPCWPSPPRGSAWCWCRSTSCSAPTRSRYILEHSGATAMVAEDALVADGGEGARRRPGRGRRARLDPAVGGRRRGGLGGRRRLVDGGPDATPPRSRVADDDPLRLMYTSGTESRPKGVMLSSRVADRAVRVAASSTAGWPPTTSRCTRCRCTTARSWTASSRSTSTSARPASSCPARTRRALLATIERERVTKLFCPPTVWISLLRHPDFDTRDLSSLRKGYYGASRDAGRGAAASCSGGCPTCGSGTSTARPRWRRWPRSCGRTSSSPHAGSAGPAGAQRRDPRWSTTTASRCRRARSARSCTAARTPRSATTTTRRRPPRRSRGGWFHSGDLGVHRRGRLPRGRRPQEGHDQDRRRERRAPGGRGGASTSSTGVAEVAVFGIPHPHWIEAVTAVVVPKAGVALTASDVDAHARRAARRLQAAQVRRVRRRAAEEPQRQDPQAGAAGAARRPRRRVAPGSRPWM